MLCYLNIFATPLPITATVINNEFVKIIEFDILNPEGLIKIYEPMFNLKVFISGNVKAAYGNRLLLDDMFIYFIMGLMYCLVVICLFILVKVKKIRNFIIKKLEQLKEKTLWNGIIRSILIGYVKLVIAVSAQFIIWNHEPSSLSIQDKAINIAIFAAAALIVLVFYVFLYKNKELLTKDKDDISIEE
jgi:hypothetical protein